MGKENFNRASKKMLEKKLYICTTVESECLAIVTQNRKSAIQFFRENRDDIGMSDCTFMDFHERSSIKRLKGFDVSTLDYGVLDAKRAVLNGIYYSTEGLCEKCGGWSHLYKADKGEFICCVKCDK